MWSVTSYGELRREAQEVERWNRLHPNEAPKQTYIQQVLEGERGPIIAATDYMKALPDMLAPWLGSRLTSLGTDGYGYSDTRVALRRHFEVDAGHVVVATLAELAAQGEIKPETVTEAIGRYGIDPEAPNPATTASAENFAPSARPSAMAMPPNTTVAILAARTCSSWVACSPRITPT